MLSLLLKMLTTESRIRSTISIAIIKSMKSSELEIRIGICETLPKMTSTLNKLGVVSARPKNAKGIIFARSRDKSSETKDVILIAPTSPAETNNINGRSRPFARSSISIDKIPNQKNVMNGRITIYSIIKNIIAKNL